MSKSSVSLPQSGPNVSDIGRLWETIKKDFVSDLRIELRPFILAGDGIGLVLELVSDSVEDINGVLWVHVWSAKTFTNPFHLISTSQLYDLLIVGYRTMEKYFEQGEAFAPSKRPR